MVPIAIDAASWAGDRGHGSLPAGDPLIRNLVVRLKSNNPAAATGPNAALIAFQGFAPVVSEATRQIRLGVRADDVPNQHLGPATSTSPLVVPGSNALSSAAQTQALADALLEVAASDDPRRVFPLYESFDATTGARLIGFVAARVLAADDEEPDAAFHRLRLTIEPCFLIHSTAWTDSSAPRRNLYIHQLRLFR